MKCSLATVAGVSAASEETKHWRGKRLFVNNGLPLQCFVCSEPADVSVPWYTNNNVLIVAILTIGVDDKAPVNEKVFFLPAN